jgi:hypothetical protein
MKEMKLIMENFKKNMSEMFKGRELTDDELEKMDPTMRGFIEKSRKSKGITSQAAEKAAETVRQEILDLYDNRYKNIQDIVDDESVELDVGKLKVMLNRNFGDAHAELGGTQGIEAGEREMLKMFDILGVLEDDESDGLAPSDAEDPPGFMPGQGGNY